MTKLTPAPLREFIQRCWSADPDERPTFDECFEEFRSGRLMWPNANAKEIQKFAHMLQTQKSKQEDSKKKETMKNKSKEKVIKSQPKKKITLNQKWKKNQSTKTISDSSSSNNEPSENISKNNKKQVQEIETEDSSYEEDEDEVVEKLSNIKMPLNIKKQNTNNDSSEEAKENDNFDSLSIQQPNKNQSNNHKLMKNFQQQKKQ